MSKQTTTPTNKKHLQTNITKNGEASIYSAKGVLETLLMSAKILASDQTVYRVVERFDKITELEADIKAKDEKIASLQTEMKDTVAELKTTQHQSLSTYVEARDKIKAQIETSEGTVATLKSKLEMMNTSLQAMKSHEATLMNRIEKSNESAKMQEEGAKKALVKMKLLQESVETGNAASEKLKQALQQRENKLSESEAALARLRNDHNKLMKEHQSVSQEWEEHQTLTVSLNDGDYEPTTTKVETIWQAALELVCTAFSQDLSDTILQHKNEKAWSKLKQRHHWVHTLPIPQSNSDAAKQIRITVVLASLALAIDTHMFQPTYLLQSNSGLRALLTRQARDGSKKESAFRAMMQALLPNNQDTAASDRVTKVCHQLMEDVGELLPPQAVPAFKEDLEDLVEEAGDVWREVQRQRFAIEPSFDSRFYNAQQWRQLQFEEGRAVMKSYTRDGNGPNGDAPLFAIFPLLCINDEDGPDPVTDGVWFMRSQAVAARDEVDRLHSSPGLGRSSSAATRRRRHRRSSTEARPTIEEPKAQPFLG